MISIDLLILVFSTFRAFNLYSMMRSMNYFGQVVFEILQKNNQLKSYFGNSEIEILSDFLKFLRGETIYINKEMQQMGIVKF